MNIRLPVSSKYSRVGVRSASLQCILQNRPFKVIKEKLAILFVVSEMIYVNCRSEAKVVSLLLYLRSKQQRYYLKAYLLHSQSRRMSWFM